MMLKNVKRTSLQMCKNLGLFHLSQQSQWRKRRLLILCYHGVSLEDEHEWNPPLYMKPSDLEVRFEMLKQGGYAVLPLGEAINRLYANDLPERSVAITFDDGDYDFYKQAYPLLKAYDLPATVYISTYYCDFNKPVFDLICSYMLWKKRGTLIEVKSEASNGTRGLLPFNQTIDLRTDDNRQRALKRIIGVAERQKLSAEEKDLLAQKLARVLGVNYDELRRKRILHLMTPDEVAELSSAGIDFQLHTHRHRSPLDEQLFEREIRDNRVRIEEMTKHQAIHFCYPNGVLARQFLPWLSKENVVSATTCEPGLASPQTSALLLPSRSRRASTD